ncbi:MAG TPA: metallophosphoesterase [Thermoanaerobaculia bacterium]|nr:metallophosphoesterase [Thermoanaerobaculia bacterium]
MNSTLIFVIVVAVLAALNAATIRGLLAIHPRRRRIIIPLAIIANLFWLALPLMVGARLTWYARTLRSVLAPPWFAWLLLIILYSALLVVVGLVRLLVARRRSFTRFAQPVSTFFLIVLGLAAVAGVIQALVPLDVQHVPVTIDSLPSDFDGYRIAILSDLHVGMFSRPWRLRQISELAAAHRPDLVVLTGDMIDDDPHYVPKLLGGLSAIPAPVVAVLGNHEMYGDPREVIRRLGGSRVELLVNRGKEIRRGSSSLWLAGLSDFAAGRDRDSDLLPDLGAALRGRPSRAPIVLLSHQPKAFDLAVESAIPLTLCGHSHGGQCGYRPWRWTLAGLFIPYHIGLYQKGKSTLYVNTGTGFWLLPIRIGLSPEITIVELKRG